MADNFVANAGSGGSTFAADDIGPGVLYPRVKLSLGADGAATDALGGAGAVASGVQRVTLASDDPLVASNAAPATGTLTSVAASASDGTLLASNASRKGAIIWNDSTTATLYLRYEAAAASSSNFSVKLSPGGNTELARGGYTGIIHGVWSSATGNARITEFT